MMNHFQELCIYLDYQVQHCIKHFIARRNHYNQSDYSINNHVGGYFNTTSAIDGIQFKMDSGNIDSGTIKLYGIKDS